MLALEGVCMRRREAVVLDHVTLRVNGGEVIIVHGGRGSGKTTLLAIAAGALRPERGAVCVASRNIVDLQPSSLPFVRRNIGYLPPDPPLIRDESALENVMLALAVRGEGVSAAEKEARQALALTDITASAQTLTAHLSAGERRLLALARALAGTPPLIVLDDPTASLDAQDRERTARAIRFARDAGAAVLCASTDFAFMDALCRGKGRRVELQEGRILGGAPTITLVGLPPIPLPATAKRPATAPDAPSAVDVRDASDSR